MNIKSGHIILIWFLVQSGFGLRGNHDGNLSPKFEVGGGVGYFMPRTDFSNSHSFTMAGLWNISKTYGFRFTILNSTLSYESVDSSRHFIQFGPGIQFSFKSRDKVKGYTLIDVGFINDEKEALFIFGAGLHYRINENYVLKFELKDYHKGIGIPFMSFPNSQAGIRGEGGSKYLDFQIRVHYAIH